MKFTDFLNEIKKEDLIKKDVETKETDSDENDVEKKKDKEVPAKKEVEKTKTGNEVYDANAIKESLDKELQHKIEGYIVDACREMKISIRAVEFVNEDKNSVVVVHYNYGKEAPANYRDDKNELAKDIKEEVTSIIEEQKLKVKRVLRSTVEEGVATLTFILNETE